MSRSAWKTAPVEAAKNASPEALAFAEKQLGFSGAENAPDAFIRKLFSGPCDTAVVPMQDMLHLGSEARMNYPGTTGGNWLWRMKPDMLTIELSMKYCTLNKETGRR